MSSQGRRTRELYRLDVEEVVFNQETHHRNPRRPILMYVKNISYCDENIYDWPSLVLAGPALMCVGAGARVQIEAHNTT